MGQKSTLTQEIEVQARQMFVEGYLDDNQERIYPTLSDLVQHFGVSKATLYRRAKDQDWQKDKNRFQTELFSRREEDRLKLLVKEGEKLDTNSLQIAQAMLSRVGRRLHQAMQEETNNARAEALSTSELRELSHVAANAQKIGKLALGEAQEISKVSADVSAPESFGDLMGQLDEVKKQLASGNSHTIQ